jgi:hypothetical protein
MSIGEELDYLPRLSRPINACKDLCVRNVFMSPFTGRAASFMHMHSCLVPLLPADPFRHRLSGHVNPPGLLFTEWKEPATKLLAKA